MVLTQPSVSGRLQITSPLSRLLDFKCQVTFTMDNKMIMKDKAGPEVVFKCLAPELFFNKMIIM